MADRKIDKPSENTTTGKLNRLFEQDSTGEILTSSFVKSFIPNPSGFDDTQGQRMSNVFGTGLTISSAIMGAMLLPATYSPEVTYLIDGSDTNLSNAAIHGGTDLENGQYLAVENENGHLVLIRGEDGYQLYTSESSAQGGGFTLTAMNDQFAAFTAVQDIARTYAQWAAVMEDASLQAPEENPVRVSFETLSIPVQTVYDVTGQEGNNETLDVFRFSGAEKVLPAPTGDLSAYYGELATAWSDAAEAIADGAFNATPAESQGSDTLSRIETNQDYDFSKMYVSMILLTGLGISGIGMASRTRQRFKERKAKTSQIN